MEKKDVIQFFGRLAAQWDANAAKDEGTIKLILDNADVSEGKDILDVACGTGILIPDYLKRGAASVTAIDITPEMAEIAKAKFPQNKVTVMCGDIEDADLGRLFDCIVVYNAFPHFPDPDSLIEHLALLLKPGGALTVAHGLSRETINAHQKEHAHVSNGLMSAEELAELFERYVTVTTVIENDSMYQVAGKRI